MAVVLIVEDEEPLRFSRIYSSRIGAIQRCQPAP